MTKKPSIGPTFSERVVALARSIPRGRVATYGQIARAAGAGPMAARKSKDVSLRGSPSRAAQGITNILGKAYDSGVRDIPFHRVVYSDGHVWMDLRRRTERMKLYKNERIEIDSNDMIKNFADKLWEFK